MLLDLHRHLEGSHSPRALLDVALAFDIRNPLFDVATGHAVAPEAPARQLTMQSPSDDALVFDECIVKARAAYVSVEAIGALAGKAFREAADDTDGFEMHWLALLWRAP